MKYIFKMKYLFLIGWLLPVAGLIAQQPSAKEIVKRANKKEHGDYSKGAMKMTIIRPGWTREMSMKSWSKGDDYALILVTAPARDKGTAFLKRGNEIWNWQPTIDRTVKLPPSMMSQSWMGSDFTNDDLVKQSSIVEDFTHKLLGKETIRGRPAYKIKMIPKEDAPVVWGKVVTWIDTEEYIQLRVEFYDEEDYLVNTMIGKDIKEFDGRKLPSILEVIPADEPDQKTIIEQKWIEFDEPLDDRFFSIQNMKNLRT